MGTQLSWAHSYATGVVGSLGGIDRQVTDRVFDKSRRPRTMLKNTGNVDERMLG